MLITPCASHCTVLMKIVLTQDPSKIWFLYYHTLTLSMATTVHWTQNKKKPLFSENIGRCSTFEVDICPLWDFYSTLPISANLYCPLSWVVYNLSCLQPWVFWTLVYIIRSHNLVPIYYNSICIFLSIFYFDLRELLGTLWSAMVILDYEKFVM